MTIYELADRVGWSYETISAIERGDRKINLDHIESICPALGVEPADLFGAGDAELTPLERDVIAALRGPGHEADAMTILLQEMKRKRDA